ncbi:MAG: 4Fe-4S dicluster domain-containing protein [Gammaproteobacteria bacterium]|nr:4Fe-4S dicluster domain-containing protein [Gammaproteobacteria bacterium]MBU1723283.1 4Fe-4S dicluster domain-containing protein [Gammaproteobacteria bacterium]MBU2006578.1 4Fe-4S dicluster domain-containing protein [Gammaproteobacteria bacterium]
MVAKYVMLADTTRCIDCKACEVACRAEWDTPLGHSRDWVKQVEYLNSKGMPEVQLFPGRCQHCDDAPCVEACPSGASWKREDGIVLVDDSTCSGCELCVPACPYDARWLNPVTNTISKCTFCQPRIDQGLQPACVATCVGRALIFGDANDPNSEVSRLLGEKEWQRLITDEVNIGPNHYYFTAGKAIPQEVMPKLHERHLAGKTIENIVNPLGAIGIGGMMAVFLGAGIKKLVDRRKDVSEKEGSHEQH